MRESWMYSYVRNIMSVGSSEFSHYGSNPCVFRRVSFCTHSRSIMKWPSVDIFMRPSSSSPLPFSSLVDFKDLLPSTIFSQIFWRFSLINHEMDFKHFFNADDFWYGGGWGRFSYEFLRPTRSHAFLKISFNFIKIWIILFTQNCVENRLKLWTRLHI